MPGYSKKFDVMKSLYALQDVVYRDFNSKLIPNVSKDLFIGVRTPELRKLAKDMIKNGVWKGFIKILPHKYFEENQLHAFILSEIKDFDLAVFEIDRFLPYVNNWATCDQLNPHVLKKKLDVLYKYVGKWVASKDIYACRFAVKLLMQYWLDNDFDTKYLDQVANIKTDEYYINMMRAWYFATAAAKQFNSALLYFKPGVLDEWTRMRAIQKVSVSYRVSDKNKHILRNIK